MMTETAYTCATCPLARHLEGDRYICTAAHNHHSQVTRGHWEATADCERAIEVRELKDAKDVEYVMQLEASLQKSEAQSIHQEQFSQVAAVASYGIEIDSIKPDSYRVWAGSSLLGTMRRTSAGWMARTSNGLKSWHPTPDAAQFAVVEAALPF